MLFMVDSSEFNTRKGPDVGLLGTLANSQLRRILTATTLWGTGHQLITVSQGYLLFDLTDSTLWLAALGAAVGIPNIIVAILGGILADRIPRKRILMIGASVAGLPMLAITVLLAADALEPCQIVLLAPSTDDRLDHILEQLGDRKLLTVGDADGFGKRGVAINFVLNRGKVRFEINRKALADADLWVSSQLLKLGILVE